MTQSAQLREETLALYKASDTRTWVEAAAGTKNDWHIGIKQLALTIESSAEKD